MKKAKLTKKAKRKLKLKKPDHHTSLTVRLPTDVIDFYYEVASVSGVKVNDVLNVVLAIRAIKIVDAHA